MAPIELREGYARHGQSGLEISFKYEDLLIWMLRFAERLADHAVIVPTADVRLTPASYDYMQRIKASAYRVTRILQGSK